MEWSEIEQDGSREAEVALGFSARYVRIALKPNPKSKNRAMKLDEVWILGLGRGQPIN